LLTGVLDRRAFDEVFHTSRLTGLEPKARHCAWRCSTDNFKNVNDSYGHVFGDKVLRSIAKILKDGTKGAENSRCCYRRRVCKTRLA